MANYHVGCGITAIYAGTLNKKKDMWLNKSNVTDEAFRAVAQYCLDHDEAMIFNYHGKQYRLRVEENNDVEDVIYEKNMMLLKKMRKKNCEKLYSPEEVGEILIAEAQEDGVKWAGITRFTPSEVEKILKAESEEGKNG